MLSIAAIAIVYFITHYIAFLAAGTEESITPIWPAGGIGLAALILNPRRLWPAIIIMLYVAGFSASVLLEGRAFVPSLVFMAGNSLESLGCAWLITRVGGLNVRFTRVREVLALIGGALVVNGLTAIIGAGTAAVVRGANFAEAWRQWYVADALGILLVAPLIITWADAWPSLIKDLRRSRVVEAAVFAAIWCVAAWLTFRTRMSHHALSPQPYMLIPLLAWPAFRFGQRGVALALALLAVVAVTSQKAIGDPLAWTPQTPHERLLALQVFIGIAAIAGYLLAASYGERLSWEQELRRSEWVLRSTQSIAHLGSWELDLPTGRLIWSDEVYRVFGLKPQEFAANYETFIEAVHPDDRQAVHAAYTDSLQEGREQYEIQHRVIRRDTGEVRYVQEKCEHIRNLGGKIVRSIGMVQDITDRKRAEDSLRDSEARNRAILEAMPDLMFRLSRSGTHLDFHASGSPDLFVAENHIVGRTVTELLPEQVSRMFMNSIRHVLDQGSMAIFEYELEYAGGERRFFEARMVECGQETVLALVRNITERKQAEEELARHRDHLKELVEERTRELDESRAKLHRAERLASLGTLAAGIAHEINNPLGMMLLSTDMALRSLKDTEKLTQLLGKQKQDVERCARIVRGVLDFARQRSTARWPVDMNEVVRRSIDLTQEYARNHEVALGVSLADSLRPVLGNTTELEQVLVNLVYNAIQACSAGGHVTIETHATDTHARVVVRDDGCGMTTEEIEHIFDPFYTTRLEKGGTGLGLSTVHGIVTNHGGTIDVRSTLGRETVFTVEIPWHAETEAQGGKDTGN